MMNRRRQRLTNCISKHRNEKMLDASNAKRRVLFGRAKLASAKEQEGEESFAADASLKTAPMDSAEFSLRGVSPTPVGLSKKSSLKIKTQADSLQREGVSSSSSAERRIRFATLEIRDYPILLGDNPSISSGPPLSISWEYDNSRSFAVDVYEKGRPERRGRERMQIPRRLRENWLREAGYSHSEMRDAEQDAIKIRKSRQSSANDSSRGFGLGKEYMQRKFKRIVLKAPSDKDLYRQWKEQVSRERSASTGHAMACSN